MISVTIDEAQAKLLELVANLRPDEEVIITKDNQLVARLTAAGGAPQNRPRRPGTLRGTVLYMAPDLDAPLDEFKEYME